MVLNQNGSTVEQVNHYYPFGGLFDQTAEAVQPYKYNGKELDRTYGLDLYDYGARYMEPALGRFTTLDPLAEKYYSMSPYGYCKNNPVRFVDPTRMTYGDPEKGINLKGYLDLFVGFILSKTGFHPEQMYSENQAVQEDANPRREDTIEALHTVNETLLSVAPGGEEVYKALNDREISKDDYAWAAMEIIPVGKAGKKAGNLVKIAAKEQDVMIFSAKFGDEVVEGISDFVIKGDKLHLNKLHLQGSQSGKIGMSNLFEMARDLGRQHNVKEVIIQGGMRTTGKYKGKVPAPITIKTNY